MQGYNLFLYCANDPIGRIDITGTDSNGDITEDLDLIDDDPKEIDGGGTGGHSGRGYGNGQEYGNTVGSSGGNPTGTCNLPTVPKQAIDTLDYIRNNGSAPPGYRSREYANDGRNGTYILPDDAPYHEYDIYSFTPGVNRGAERIVVGSSGTAWYTADHYHTFIKME